MIDENYPAGEPVAPSARARDFVECLARALGAGSEASGSDLGVIGREMRKARFRHGFPQSARYVKFRRLAILATVLWVPVFLVLLIFHIANMPWPGVQPWVIGTISSAMLSLFYAPVVLICWLLALSHHRTPRVDHRVTIRTECPVCEYELRGMTPMLPVATLRGVWLGPERCPECGLYWPLIPKELGGRDVGVVPQAVEAGRS